MNEWGYKCYFNGPQKLFLLGFDYAIHIHTASMLVYAWLCMGGMFKNTCMWCVQLAIINIIT